MSVFKRQSLLVGVLLMFLLTWPIDLANAGVIPVKLPFAVVILVGWGFVIAAVLMTGLTQGKTGMLQLLKRFLLWRVSWKWYIPTLLLYPTIMLLAVVLAAAFGEKVDFDTVFAHRIFGSSANLPIYIFPLFVFNAIINGEEIGWRGYVLPRIQTRYTALTASVLVGIIWALWHIPKFLGQPNIGQFPLFIIKTVADAILYTWLYNNTKGSLFITTLFHASGNTAGAFLPIANTASGEGTTAFIFQICLIILVAVVVVLIWGRTSLSRGGSRQVET